MRRLTWECPQITREARLPAGTRLYRGLGGDKTLPAFFFRSDARGRRGALEWGFMSTTMSKWAPSPGGEAGPADSEAAAPQS